MCVFVGWLFEHIACTLAGWSIHSTHIWDICGTKLQRGIQTGQRRGVCPCLCVTVWYYEVLCTIGVSRVGEWVGIVYRHFKLLCSVIWITIRYNNSTCNFPQYLFGSEPTSWNEEHSFLSLCSRCMPSSVHLCQNNNLYDMCIQGYFCLTSMSLCDLLLRKC